jgi:DNA-directed RNA polymerase subunit RPC12/RpoP
MICPYCGNKIKVTHTYSGGRDGRTQSAWCKTCKKRFTIVSVILDSDRHGGAYKIAKKMERSPEEEVD